jgi:sec-independent protein translocase protein TatA
MPFSFPGPLELVVVLVIALIVLGPQRLPETARSVGKGMRELRDALSGRDEDEDDEEDEDEDEDPVLPAETATRS